MAVVTMVCLRSFRLFKGSQIYSFDLIYLRPNHEHVYSTQWHLWYNCQEKFMVLSTVFLQVSLHVHMIMRAYGVYHTFFCYQAFFSKLKTQETYHIFNEKLQNLCRIVRNCHFNSFGIIHSTSRWNLIDFVASQFSKIFWNIFNIIKRKGLKWI